MAKEQSSQMFEPTVGWRALVALFASTTVFAADYVSKVFVRNTLALTGESVPVIPGVLSFRFVANTGAAFSMGEGMGLAFAAFAAVVVVAIVMYLGRTKRVSRVETLGLGLVAGGAVGNAVDRMVLGYVVDFIASDFIDFPVFNVADIGICVGVFLAFIGFMFLSPAAKVDATSELNARDERAAERRAARRAHRASARHADGRRAEDASPSVAPSSGDDRDGDA